MVDPTHETNYQNMINFYKRFGEKYNNQSVYFDEMYNNLILSDFGMNLSIINTHLGSFIRKVQFIPYLENLGE